MADLAQLERALFNADAAGDTAAATMLANEIRSIRSAAPARDKFDLRGEGYDKVMNYSGKDAVAGAVRGAGSIGATLLRPFESAQDNQQRRTAMDGGLAELGANPNSDQFKANKLIAEVAGTSGAGGLIAKGLGAIPGVAKALPTLLPAIESGGMVANGAKGVYGLANRAAGGAISGGASVGLANPEDAPGGAMVGGFLPPALKAAGATAQAIRAPFVSTPMNPVMAQTAKESIDAGYVIPPNMVRPSFPNQVLESISGKQATQQIASTKNTATTEKLVRGALGIADDVPLTKSTLEGLRKTAGKAYSDVASISSQAAADLEALKLARNEAQGWFNSYNRSASPADLAKAKAFREEAQNLENMLEFHALQAGKDELIPALQKARKEIAKAYTVERALNDAAGTVDARVLGRIYEKGAPLSDGLDVAGKFASAFPTVAKSPQQVGSPAAHNLRAMASMLAGGAGYAGAGPAGLAMAALPMVSGPAARSIMFSNRAQRGLLDTAGPSMLDDPAIGLLTQGAYRAGPLLSQ